MTTPTHPKRALISASDKAQLRPFAEGLIELGFELLSTGGTFAFLRKNNLACLEVSEYTGFPEIMDGRVKTLHPKIHGGILARTGIDDQVLHTHHIRPIDLVVVNLYPFVSVIQEPFCSFEHAIENIDIGGPSMIRAAAKNHQRVGVIVDPLDYPRIIEELTQHATLSTQTKRALAQKAFVHTARYDQHIAGYLSAQISTQASTEKTESATALPPSLSLQFDKVQDLRYGENPHQRGAWYQPTKKANEITALSSFHFHQGKELSFNNLVDLDTAGDCVDSFSAPACVIVKHANPCGVAVALSLDVAYDAAYRTDPTSAFGGIIAFNRLVEGKTAEKIIQRQFVEVIVAPDFTTEALTIFATKPMIRVITRQKTDASLQYKAIQGGLLVQEPDIAIAQPADFTTVSKRQPNENEWRDFLFAWSVAKYVKSNAIVFAKDQCTLGVGAGQTSRVYSTKIAAIKAADEGLSLTGSVLASDAFFPFRDGVDTAIQAGISGIIQPGGSRNDAEVIAAADEAGIAMVFTHRRHFRH